MPNTVVILKFVLNTCIVIATLCSLSLQAQDLSKYANIFLGTLTPGLKEKAQFTFAGDERFNWHYIPKQREGITFANLNLLQKNAAVALLKASMSQTGYDKTTAIIELESVLKMLENRPADDHYRDPLNYHFTIFGKPAPTNIWAWRLEGHHVSLNFTSSNGTLVSCTPSFLGSNPGTVNRGQQNETQILQHETDLAFKLIHSLTPPQLSLALISQNAPGDIVSGNKKKAEPLTPNGIKITDLNNNQQTLLRNLLAVYLKNYSSEMSQQLTEKLKGASIDNLYFAWAGSLQPGSGHYYRIQTPVLLIEYDNTQNNANHIHTVVRDLTNDFGEDVLQAHYQKQHH